MPRNFALIGAAGFVAPRHMQAIHDTGNVLVAACDRSDNVGILDRWFPDCRFFTEIERFDRHLEKLRRRGDDERVHAVSICSPNYLHDAHIRLALRLHATAICEKPLVINPWNLDQLEALEQEYGTRVYSILQLRLHPDLAALKRRLDAARNAGGHDVVLTYVTRRGRWYDVSWKGRPEQSGGVAMNIGVHFFDLLMWLLGPCRASEVHLAEPRRMAGALELERGTVRWFLSVEAEDLPEEVRAAGRHAWRSITLDGEEIEFSGGFTDLHTRSYREILDGRGFGIADARPSIELVHRIRSSPVVRPAQPPHPRLAG
ncbi:MAG: Gfo/Idh/MocA family oxidoreductase [Acidobacteriota bacterium]